MQFLHPAALWLLLLVPLILLARRREPAARLDVATLRFWRDAPAAPLAAKRRLRFQIDRRTLLEAAFLSTLIVAIARPSVSAGGSTVAIVVDTSMSMGALDGGTTRLDAARRQIESLMDRLPRGTNVRLIEATLPPRVVAEGRASIEATRTALAALTAGAAPADLDDAIGLATHGDRVATRTYVFTDRAPASDAGTTDVEWTMVGRAADNIAITSLSTRRGTPRNGMVDALVEAANFGGAPVTSALTLERDGRRLSQQSIQLAERDSVRVLVPIAEGSGILTARLDATDALPMDNERRAVVAPPVPLRVRLVGDSFFVRRALAAHPGVELADAAASDVTVCDGCADVPAGTDGLILLPPRSQGLGAAAVLVQTGDTLGRLGLDGVSVVPMVRDTPIDNASIVARAAGVPVVLAYTVAGRRIVELRIDPDASELSLHPAFPMLIARALDWAATGANATEIEAGTPLDWRLPGRTSVVVTTPNGENIGAAVEDGHLLIGRTAAAGVYRVNLGQDTRTFVVNPAARVESDLQQSRTTGTDHTLVTAEPGSFKADLTSGLLAAALMLLALEWYVSRPRPSRLKALDARG